MGAPPGACDSTAKIGTSPRRTWIGRSTGTIALRLGGEATRYSIGRFESALAALGDAYIERPERWDVFVEDRLDLGDVVLVGGLRYDRYASRASRPFLLDTVSASPTFGRYLNLAGAPEL